MTDFIAAHTSSYQPDYVGRFWKLFRLAFGQALLTILTLGIGRFWMITNLRRYYWSSVVLDGDPLEYTGRPLEKLIGFFVAVVILAAYLAAVNLALAYIGLSYFKGDVIALNLSILSLIPLGFWAQYRARRYILARTRWRGIRFGALPGAWGYMFRAMGWWLVTILSVGLFYPLMQMDLARYRTDRTYFGDLPFRQGGRVWPLMGSWLLVWAPVVAAAAWLALDQGMRDALANAANAREPIHIASAEGDKRAATAALVALGAFLWLAVGWLRHSIYSFRYLNSNRVLGRETSFTVTLGFWRVVWIHVAGALLIGLVMSVLIAVASMLGLGATLAIGASLPADMERIAGVDLRAIGIMALILSAYVGVVLFLIVLAHVFITQPLLRAFCRNMRIRGLAYATRAQQRPHDHQSEAGGFADALGADVGGAF